MTRFENASFSVFNENEFKHRLNAYEYKRSNAVWIMFKRCFKKIQTRKKRVQIKHGITQSAKQCLRHLRLNYVSLTSIVIIISFWYCCHYLNSNRSYTMYEASQTHIYSWTPLFRSPKGNGKKFEIAGFRNNRGNVKFVTMNHFFNKIQYSLKKDTD